MDYSKELSKKHLWKVNLSDNSLSKNHEKDAPYYEHITSLNCKTSRGLQLEYIYPSINSFRDRLKIESANVELIGETR